MKNTVKIKASEGFAALNLRHDPGAGTRGWMTVRGLPMRVAGLPLRPLCAVGTHVIAADGGCLYALTPGVANPLLLADLGAEGECYCAIAGGDRAIVMTSAGAQHIAVDGNGEAVCLGTLPGLPPVSLSLDDAGTYTESISATELTDADALRRGMLGDDDAAALRSKLAEAWARIEGRARAAGAVIVAPGGGLAAEVRQLDGAGAAVASRGVVAVGGASEVAAAYADLSDGRVGPFALTVSARRVRAEIGALDREAAAVWGADAGTVEIALGAAPAVSASWTFRVEHAAGGESRLAVVTALVSAAPSLSEPRQSVGRHAAGEATMLLLTPPAEVDAPVAEAPRGGFVARAGAVSGDVVLWADIDGRRGEAAVAPASSPLALTGRATLSLAPIAAVEPAPRLGSAAFSPGCAHFYAFTPDGVLNVAVNSRRGAPTASLLDRRGVSRREAVGAGPERVVAVADGGSELVVLRGARSATFAREAGAGWRDAAFDPSDGSVAVTDVKGNMTIFAANGAKRSAAVMTFAPEALAGAGGRLWIVSADALFDGGGEVADGPVAMEWRGEAATDGAVKSLRLDLEAPGGFDGSVELFGKGFAGERGADGNPLFRAALKGEPRGPIRFLAAVPRRAAVEVRVRGFAAPGSRLYGVELEMRDGRLKTKKN